MKRVKQPIVKWKLCGNVNELKNLWAEMDLTVHEAVTELATLSSAKIKIGDVSLHQIPLPRYLGERLLNLANVVLPEALPCNNINVTTTRKLPGRRKRKITEQLGTDFLIISPETSAVEG